MAAAITPEKYNLDTDTLNSIYDWVDQVQLSRPKRNIARDFSDAAMAAEVIKHFLPKKVELHNYPAANSTEKKIDNWTTLSTKVLQKVLHLRLSQEDIRNVATCKLGAIEWIDAQMSEQGSPASIRARGAHPREGGAEQQEEGAEVDAEGVDEQGQHEGGKGSGDEDAEHLLKENALLQQVLQDRDRTIAELKEVISLQETKVQKLEEQNRIKDSRIRVLTSKLKQAGITV